MKIKYRIRRPDVWIVHACIVKPLQIIQNAAPHLIFDQTNRTNTYFSVQQEIALKTLFVPGTLVFKHHLSNQFFCLHTFDILNYYYYYCCSSSSLSSSYSNCYHYCCYYYYLILTLQVYLLLLIIQIIIRIIDSIIIFTVICFLNF